MHQLLKYNMREWLHLILGIIFVLYLVIDEDQHPEISKFTKNNLTKVFVVLLVFYLFIYTTPVLGVLGLLATLKLFTSSDHFYFSSNNLFDYAPTEEQVFSKYTATNQFPSYTLEEEIISKMTDSDFNYTYEKTPWRPVLTNTNNSEYLNS